MVATRKFRVGTSDYDRLPSNVISRFFFGGLCQFLFHESQDWKGL